MPNTNTLKYFSVKLLVFALPVSMALIMFLLADPFKVLRHHDDYHESTFVSLNREFICLKLYEQNINKLHYNSFIFGSSRSLAFRVKQWEKLLPPESKGFHFDGNGEGIYGIYNKIRYIDETGGALKNALIVLDQFALTTVKNRRGHIFISPPELSQESSVDFYLEFFKSLSNLGFIIGYIDYSLFNTHRSYMGDLFSRTSTISVCDNLTGDVYFGADKIIREDKLKFYSNGISNGTFYDRTKLSKRQLKASMKEFQLLSKIKQIFDKHQTDYRIVVSPLYDQIPLGEDHLLQLKMVFGPKAIYDYSGINKYTASVFNFYDDSHYTAEVADDIMKEIYSN